MSTRAAMIDHGGVMVKDARLDRQIQFILEIDKLKDVLRRSYVIDSQRRENDSEHSWHIAVMALVLSEYADEDIEISRVANMCLIHDIVEIDAGDTHCYDEVAAADQSHRERMAAERLFGLLPVEQGESFRNLWEEFEEGLTSEAKFAHTLDRLMPLLHNYYTAGMGWQEHGIARQQVLDRMLQIRSSSERLWQYVVSLIDDAVEKGYLPES